MNTYVEKDNQQPSILMEDEGSETIPKGSRDAYPEAVSTLTTGDVEGKDIVHIQSNRLNSFLNNANKKHNNKFDYSKFVYINAKTRGTIICPIHGEFEQTADKHLQSKYACPGCLHNAQLLRPVTKKTIDKVVSTKIRNSKIKFLKEANIKYNNKFKYDMSTYTGITGAKIKITCPTHGEFFQSPVNHIQSLCGCKICGIESSSKTRTKSYKEFLNKVSIIHNNEYTYPNIKTEYVNRKSIISIKCKNHGIFKLSARKYISGRRCPKCNIHDLIVTNKLVGGYFEDLFSSRPELKDLPATIYYLSINNSAYFKIGITRVSLKNRLKGLKAKALTHNVIIRPIVLQTKNMTLYEAFVLEQSILQKYKPNRIYTQWSTELFNVDINPFNKIE